MPSHAPHCLRLPRAATFLLCNKAKNLIDRLATKVYTRTGVRRKLRTLALIATAAVAAALAILVVWLWTPRSSSFPESSLTPAEVHQILKTASEERWEMVRFALRKRECKLFRQFILARIESFDANPPWTATVTWRVAFEPSARLIMTFQHTGAHRWSFERWVVTEQKTRKPAPQPVLSGTTNAATSIRSVDAPQPIPITPAVRTP
jgi:hypothetical protein